MAQRKGRLRKCSRRFISFADATFRNSIKHVRLISYRSRRYIFAISYVRGIIGGWWEGGWGWHLARETIFQ